MAQRNEPDRLESITRSVITVLSVLFAFACIWFKPHDENASRAAFTILGSVGTYWFTKGRGK